MLRIGLTGGIGSGKTTVENIFKSLDVPVIDADQISHSLIVKGNKVYAEIIDTFGEDIIDENKEINRTKLAEIVFHDSASRNKLEKILHPKVRLEMLDQLSKIQALYVVLSIPLLFEANQRDIVDRILVIDIPVEEQILRVKERDHRGTEEIEAIISNQITREARLSHADDILENNSDLAALRNRVEDFHKTYTSMARHF